MLGGKSEMTNQKLVRAIRESLPTSHEWTESDGMLLELAEAQAGDLDLLEGMVGPEQPLGVVREARNQRIALGRLIGLVDIPTETSTGSLHATKAAKARWQAVGSMARMRGFDQTFSYD